MTMTGKQNWLIPTTTSATFAVFAALLSSPCAARAQSMTTQSQSVTTVRGAGVAPEVPHPTNSSGHSPVGKTPSWHFQTTYGLSSADMEAPYWNTAVDPVAEAQRSTSGVLTQIRYSHSLETPLEGSQALRWGVSLVNDRTAAKNSWASALVKESKAPEWRAWGIGTDVFLVRRLSSVVDFDAGLQADYFLSGVATLGASDTTTASQASPQNRLEQKSAWRLTFTGGIGGLYAGPVGLILRVSGYVMQASFKTHSQPLRAQGLQLQIGMDLALGRGEP